MKLDRKIIPDTDLRVKGDWTAPWEVKHSSEDE